MSNRLQECVKINIVNSLLDQYALSAKDHEKYDKKFNINNIKNEKGI